MSYDAFAASMVEAAASQQALRSGLAQRVRFASEPQQTRPTAGGGPKVCGITGIDDTTSAMGGEDNECDGAANCFLAESVLSGMTSTSARGGRI